MPKRAENLLKLDVFSVLGPDEASYDQSFIGVMRQMIEIGCNEINTKVSLLSSYLAMLRQWCFEAAFHVMSYFNLNIAFQLAFNPSNPGIDQSHFWNATEQISEGAVEAIPSDAPLHRGTGGCTCL